MYDDYLKTAVEIALKAGKLIKDNFSLYIEKEIKSDNTPVTKVDKEVNRMIIDTIKKRYKDHSVLGEEESTELGSEYIWVCDPLDGTIPYVHGMQISTTSIALTYKGESIVGVVYDPYQDLLYSASKGNGAFLNNKKIKVSDNTSLENEVITVEAGFNFSDLILALRKGSIRSLHFGSFVYGAKYVASGQISASIFTHSFPWDGAAIKVIVEEAGGKVTDLFGEERDFSKLGYGLIVSNGKVHDKIIKIVKNSIDIDIIKGMLT